ncbi:MAG: hypothetical protein KTR21_01175 [Rhodobacteraceae bacterium]|nr:hypothetical protein [Paracoccaceae bacterium]
MRQATRPKSSTRKPRAAKPPPQAPLIDDVDLASMLSSRLCHDLVGAVGAVQNGVEIIEDGADPEFRDNAMKLIANSALQATARLEYYRAAFGAGGSLAEDVQVSEVEKLTERYLNGGKITLDWEPGEPAVDRKIVRLLLNMILVGVEALRRGGVLRVGVIREDVLNLVVVAEGRSARLREEVCGLLRTGGPAPGEIMEADDSPFVLTYRLAQRLETRLSIAQDQDRVIIASALDA